MAKGPVLIEIEDEAAPKVADAPPVPDTVPVSAPQGDAMQMVARVAARKPSRLGRLFWGLTGALLAAVLSAAAWDFVNAWIARAPVVGWAFTGLMAAFLLTLAVIALRDGGSAQAFRPRYRAASTPSRRRWPSRPRRMGCKGTCARPANRSLHRRELSRRIPLGAALRPLRLCKQGASVQRGASTRGLSPAHGSR